MSLTEGPSSGRQTVVRTGVDVHRYEQSCRWNSVFEHALLSSNTLFSLRTRSSLSSLRTRSSLFENTHISSLRTRSSLFENVLLPSNTLFSLRKHSSLYEHVLLSSNTLFSLRTRSSLFEHTLLPTRLPVPTHVNTQYRTTVCHPEDGPSVRDM